MADSPTVHVTIDGERQRQRIVYTNGDSESLLLSCARAGLFRLEESSLLGVSQYHDIIRASSKADRSLEFRGVVALSGFHTEESILSKSLSNDTNPFHAISIGQLTLANRIVMAPMTRSFSPDGVPGPDVAAYYRRRAEGGVGLIVTEGTYIAHPSSGFDPRVPHLYGDDALAGWRRVVTEVHAAGGRIFPQLWHVGHGV